MMIRLSGGLKRANQGAVRGTVGTLEWAKDRCARKDAATGHYNRQHRERKSDLR
jgi:hypothetical protein